MDQKPEAQATEGAGAVAGARTSVALSSGRGGIVGIKAGMTQVFDETGHACAVTVIELRPAVVTQIKTKANEGYNAVQIGILEKKASKASKSELGHGKKSNSNGYYHRQEIRFPDDAKLDGVVVGNILSPGFLKAGDMVDLTAWSKGKGFQGGMKRFHMSGGHKTHGASVSHRSLGSIGNRADPGKCFKNKKMAGHMGHEMTTVQNIQVVRIDDENQLILVHGSVPGPRSGIVTVRKAVKSR